MSAVVATIGMAFSPLVGRMVFDIPSNGAELVVLVFGLPFALGGAVALGLPLWMLLRKRVTGELRAAALAGAITGFVVGVMLRSPGISPVTASVVGLVAAAAGMKVTLLASARPPSVRRGQS